MFRYVVVLFGLLTGVGFIYESLSNLAYLSKISEIKVERAQILDWTARSVITKKTNQSPLIICTQPWLIKNKEVNIYKEGNEVSLSIHPLNIRVFKYEEDCYLSNYFTFGGSSMIDKKIFKEEVKEREVLQYVKALFGLLVSALSIFVYRTWHNS